MAADKVETRKFEAETKQVLDLMVHSLYSHKEIFLRELISNGSDALDKLRFEAVTRPELLQGEPELSIRLEIDKDARTLTVHDNGIGMSREEVITQIGTIAKSGTRELWERVQKAGDSDLPGELIGQFGVGFYSAFMVADKVVLVTRRAGEEGATRWESTGQGEYELSEAARDEQGTSVTLHLRAADPEIDLADFADPLEVRRVVKRYSDFVRYPIRLADETLNSMKAIWKKRASEVSQEEYEEFYKHVAHAFEAPLETITLLAEGRFEYSALLYVPQRAPFDLAYPSFKSGPQLYVRSVKIMENCEQLLPRYLRFLKGVVDSSDLPLNVSRELLQQHGQIRILRQGITKKVLDSLAAMKEKDADKYLGFWREFGRVLKEGVAGHEEHEDKLLPLLLFESSRDPKELTTLAEYVERMPEEQKEIYYLSGESRALVESSPQLEAFKARGVEVLYFLDPIDEFMVNALREVEGKPLKSAAKGEVELGTPEEKEKAEKERAEKAEELSGVLVRLEKRLSDQVKEVRLSSRLTDSPVCLVGGEGDLSPHLERLLKQEALDVPSAKRILELNPSHPIAERMKEIYRADSQDPLLDDYADLLLGQAHLAEGAIPPNLPEFNRLVAKLMS